MHSNIVKIKQEDKNIFGSGIIISGSKVLTAAHVVADADYVDVILDEEPEGKFEGKIEYFDEFIAIIYVGEDEFNRQYSMKSDNVFFSTFDHFDESSKWEVEGYITEKLEKHRLEGIGIYATEESVVDYTLGKPKSGISNNYGGMSGSPVILNGRIIGIIQMQQWAERGNLGICFTSITKFADKLPCDVVLEPTYICELRKSCFENCNKLINKNKEIAKYIPEIFIEENMYKENLRYFSLPILFINKIIYDLKKINFHSVNIFLKKEKKREIIFPVYLDEVDSASYDSVVSSLTTYLKKCITVIEQIDNKKNDGYTIEEIYTQGYFINSSIKWDLKELLSQLEYLSYRVLLLTRNAGQGKTNFVCDFTENFLIKREIISLFFNAADFCDTPVNVLQKYFTQNGKYTKNYAENVLTWLWKKTGIPVVIVIDGLNENISLPNFENHILQALKEWIKLPFLKIIMTTRCELLKERFGKLSKENIGEEFSIVDMSGCRDDKFKNRIFDGYLNHFDVHIVRESLKDDTYNLLANDTLLLRFFCEVNRGKEQVYMYDVYKYTLFESYYKNKKNEIKEKKIIGSDSLFDRLMSNICDYMIENKVFNNIPRDALSATEIQLLDYLLECDIIFKEDRMVKKGFLEKPIEVLSFTFDEFRDFCITRHLLMQEDAIQSFPIIWNIMCKENWSILEGVEKYLFCLARTTVPEILPIIEENSNFPNMYWRNIWELEDGYITDQDVDRWRAQFACKGKYRRHLINYLLKRRNKDYFKKASVDLLFEFMDEISEKPGELDDFVKTFFPVREDDRSNQNECVFYSDQMVKELSKGMDDNRMIDYYTFLKISVYLYGIMPNDIKDLWIKASFYRLELIKKITNEFLRKDYLPVVVKSNLRDIYETLDAVTEEECIGSLKEKCNNADMYRCTLSTLSKIWE